MKKYLFLLLATVTIYGQTYPTNPTAFGKISINTNVEDNSAAKITVQSSDNRINWLQPINIPISIVPTNYAPTAPTLGGHISGIDAKLGALTGTTAGISTRVWFTADQTTITAGTFDLTNPLNKGTVASHQQTVANDDGQKKYFTTDLIGQPFAMATLFPQGLYAGNLSVSTTPTNANQKFTVELYKCNNAGTPIASGVAGAAVGDLGVTVIMILDSGEVTLANASVTNVGVSTILGSAFNIAVGERIRYHVSAEKVGTAGAVINESVYYGSSYNSFLDVPVIYNSTSIKDVSAVTNGSGTVTDALNSLKAAIPVNYSKIVYVDATNPNAATIFDDENPPTVNDNALKADVANLYVGTDASGWVYNSTSLTYVTKAVTSITSNFYLSGTTTDAGTTKTGAVYRTGNTGFNKQNPVTKVDVGGSIGVDSGLTNASNRPVVNTGTLVNGEIRGYSDNNPPADFGFLRLSAGGGTTTGQKSYIDLSGFSAVSDMNRNIVFGTAGVERMRILNNGTFGIGTNSPVSKLDIFTGASVTTYNLAILPSGTISFANNDITNAVPTIYSKSSNSTGLSIVAGTSDSNIDSDFKFIVKETDDTDFSTLTSSAFSFVRGSTTLVNVLRNGNVTANAIDTNTTKITITTSTSITTTTTDANGIRQDGRHVVIDNGVNVINLTCNGGVTASYGKIGTGAITFVQGSGRTLVQLSGTAVFNGVAGSTATLWSNGTTDYLSITNY